jgi:hypothetical protein
VNSSPTAISVLLTAGPGAGLDPALESLAAQTLPPDRFEVVVVARDAGGGPGNAVRAVTERHPHLRPRLVTAPGSSEGRARNLGLLAARGDYVTTVDGSDRISPGYLEAMLAHASPGVIPLAQPATVAGAAPAPLDGTIVAAVELSGALALDIGKLAPTLAAREVGYAERLADGAEVVFWTGLFARHPFRFHVIAGQDATYARTRTADPDTDVTTVLDRLSCLERIGAVASDVEQLLQRVVSDQCERIREHLSAHPDERAAVTKAIEERALRRFDWSTVNRGLAEDLVLLYGFTPWNSTGGMVAARRVRERGVLVDVIAKNQDGTNAVDPTSTALAAPFVASQVNVGGPVSAFKWRAVVAFSERVFATLRSGPTAGKTYRSVYSRAMWPPSHFVTAQYKLRNPGTRWIAEFSDPLDRNVEGKPRSAGTVADDAIIRELRDGIRAAGFTPPDNLRLFQWAEWIAYALADEIVFTNENQRRYMLGYCADPALADRVRTISRVAHHPTPPPLLYELNPTSYPLDPDRVHLAYFGVFYATRGLDELTGALAALSGPERARVQLHVFTKDADGVRAEVAASGLADVVAVNPYVGYTAFLNLTRKFDALLVNDAQTSEAHDGINPYLPSKVSDYLGSGTPIWAIYEPGSVLSTIPVAHRTELGDTAAAADTLRAIIAADRPAERTEPRSVP